MTYKVKTSEMYNTGFKFFKIKILWFLPQIKGSHHAQVKLEDINKSVTECETQELYRENC